MAKKLIQRYLPSPASLRKNKYLSFLGSALHDTNLWHINRRSTATAFFVGIFCAFLPIPFQMMLAASVAVFLRCNLPISVALAWITNPLTMPAIFYITYKIGCYILQIPANDTPLEFTINRLGIEIIRVWKPLFVGSVLTGILSGGLAYLVIRIGWRWNIIRTWRNRHKSKSSP